MLIEEGFKRNKEVTVNLTQLIRAMHNICKVWGLKPDTTKNEIKKDVERYKVSFVFLAKQTYILLEGSTKNTRRIIIQLQPFKTNP